MQSVQNVAIVGLGSVGKRHLRLLKELRPTVEAVVVRSASSPPCQEELLASRRVETVSQALDCGVQAAIIASPAPLHVPQAMEFAAGGCHMLVEKPLSARGIDAGALCEVVRNAGIVACVGYVLRFDPAAAKFAELLNTGAVGRPLNARISCSSYLPDWRPGQDYRLAVSSQAILGGGVLTELSHELDYADWFFGPFDHVSCALSNSGVLDVDVPDSADLILKSSEGLPVSIHLDFNTLTVRRSCTVVGTQGELAWNVATGSVSLHRLHGGSAVWDMSTDRDSLYTKQLTHFLSCIESHESPTVDLDQGERILRIVTAAERSDASGRRVTL